MVPTGGSSRELSFGQALELLHSNNESLRAVTMEMRQREQEQSATRGLYFPKVNLNGSYTKIDDPTTLDLNAIRTAMLQFHPEVPAGMVPSFEETFQDDRFWKATATMTWPLFTGGRILAANRAADAVVAEVKEKMRSTESALISSLAEYYFGLCLAQNIVTVRRQVLDGMERHLYHAQKLEEHGMISRSERLHAEVTHAEADRKLKKAVRDETISQSTLKSILSFEEPVTPVSHLFLLRAIKPLSFFQREARLKNPIMKQIAARKEQAHQNYKIQLGTFSPEVYLFGMRELYTQDLTVLEPEWAVGVGVNVTLFEGFARAKRVSAALYQEKRVSYLEERAVQNIETLVEKYYNEVMKAIEQFDCTETSLESAREYLRIRSRAFEEGYASSIDVIDAQLALSRVKIERLTAAYTFDVFLAKLLEAAGLSDSFDIYPTKVRVEVDL